MEEILDSSGSRSVVDRNSWYSPLILALRECRCSEISSTVDEVSSVAFMLAGNGYITGQTINVNGD